MITGVTIDHLVAFDYVMGRLTSPMSIEKMRKNSKFHSICVILNKMVISVNNVAFELQTSIKRS